MSTNQLRESLCGVLTADKGSLSVETRGKERSQVGKHLVGEQGFEVHPA